MRIGLTKLAIKGYRLKPLNSIMKESQSDSREYFGSVLAWWLLR